MKRTLSSRNGRLFALSLGGVCLFGILLPALLSWRSLLTEYYLRRLTGNAEYAWRLVEDHPKVPSAVDEALRRFLAEATGRDWFLGELWTHVVEPNLMDDNPEVGVVLDQGAGKATAFWRFDDMTKTVYRTRDSMTNALANASVSQAE